MSDPLTFDDATPRYALPLLYSGQAEKELFVNEAHALVDALLHCSIEGEAAAPPTDPDEGQNWLVAVDATAEWAGYDHHIACRQAGNWLFIAPRAGMRVFDISNGQERLFFDFWRKASAPMEPAGGTIVDGEARTAIANLIAALRVIGIFPV